MNFATVGPFYAVQIAPQYTGTIGGVVTDTSAQVLRADGTVIGGLYAAGEASNGALYDLVYMSGSSFLNALSMGRIAGENAAKRQMLRRAGAFLMRGWGDSLYCGTSQF